MPTIELSPGFVSGGYLPRLFTSSAGSQISTASLTGPNSTNSTYWFRIYQGSVPTDFSTLTAETSRSSDLLINWEATGNAGYYLSASAASNPCLLSTLSKAASASGTATWFRSLVVSNTNVMLQQFIGTVGLSGSGADLEIDSTTIVSGNSYRVTNLRIQMPTSWTY